MPARRLSDEQERALYEEWQGGLSIRGVARKWGVDFHAAKRAIRRCTAEDASGKRGGFSDRGLDTVQPQPAQAVQVPAEPDPVEVERQRIDRTRTLRAEKEALHAVAGEKSFRAFLESLVRDVADRLDPPPPVQRETPPLTHVDPAVHRGELLIINDKLTRLPICPPLPLEWAGFLRFHSGQQYTLGVDSMCRGPAIRPCSRREATEMTPKPPTHGGSTDDAVHPMPRGPLDYGAIRTPEGRFYTVTLCRREDLPELTPEDRVQECDGSDLVILFVDVTDLLPATLHSQIELQPLLSDRQGSSRASGQRVG